MLIGFKETHLQIRSLLNIIFAVFEMILDTKKSVKQEV